VAIRTSENLESIIPSEQEIKLAQQFSKILSGVSLKKAKSVDILLEGVRPLKGVTLPLSVFKLLMMALTQMAKGNAVMLLPVNAELTTQKAADLLNVSRPYLIRLLEENKIPFRKVGTHRKILLQDIMLYKLTIDKARLKILDELTQEAQNLKMGY
jgi:excisionase family DNA binding protein